METFVRTNKISGRLEERLQRRLKNIEPIINDKLEYFAKSNFSKLGKLTTQASKYMKKEWQAMNRILQDENLEISNNLDERMMRRIKLNLKNCLNIGREDSALDYAFMYFVSESYDINGDGI
ncbi:hypothetical protein DW075_02510 [Bacteroides xylanisolvens]|uniref:Transposase IS66 central domain-containing protein n=1 Tax=Bacteroides xylanisolvens TaxID=371601 RepID=A0A415G0Y1_9BACE|nr:transposase [Bacteroides xylanisolvens]RHK29399.1 hypothetical protein DW075_02510 [Bacteroides xylanisolvens]